MPERKSLGALISETPALIIDLFRSEVSSLKGEVADRAKGFGLGGGLLAGAGVFGLFALGWLLTAGFEALSLVLASWLSALIVAAFVGLIAGILALVGQAKIKARMGALQSVESMKDDVNMIKGLGHASDGTDPLDDLGQRKEATS